MYVNLIEMSMLYDFYGKLLTEKQKSVMDLFHEDDYTQSEVADRLGISRQAVHDAVKNCEKALLAFEEKLGLVQKFSEAKAALEKNNRMLDGIITDGAAMPGVVAKLREIQRNNSVLIENM